MFKQFLPTSLLGRSLLILVLPVLLVQFVTGYVFFDRHWNRMVERLSDSAVGEIAFILRELEKHPDAEAYLAQSAIYHFDLNVTQEEGAKLARPNHVDAPLGWEAMIADIFLKSFKRQIDNQYQMRFDFQEKWVYVSVQTKTGVVHISMPERRIFSSSGYVYLLWVFASAMLLLIVSVLFMRNQVRPIRKLAVAADRFGKGKEVDFFKPEGAREVRQAGTAFLTMARRIRAQIEQQTMMLAGVSHDLRTPLTRLRLELSMLPKDVDASAMLSDIHDMEVMVHGYLNFIRGSGDEKPQDINLENMIMDITRGGFQNDTVIKVKSPKNLILHGKENALRRCFSNVISNAAKHASHIYITLEAGSKNTVHITVEDNGPGIAEDQITRVLEPFYRIEQGRTASQGSVGLGLAIVKEVVDDHNGDITLGRSDAYGGLRVHISLPVWRG